MKKKSYVVMLPTNDKAPIAQWNKGNKYLSLTTNTRNLEISEDETYQHLYILSNEKIKEGDWFIANQGIFQCLEVVEGNYPYKVANQYNKGEIQYQSKHWLGNKVIATTDKSIGLPYPSPEFVQAYIKAYNAGKLITEVMVEYEEYLKQELITGTNASFRAVTKSKLKVDSNNCITITKVKDSWTREEVIAIIHSICGTMYKTNTLYAPHSVERWIEQNL